MLFHAQFLLPLSQGMRKPSIVDAVTLMLSIGKQGSFGRSGLQRESIVPGLAIRPEVAIVELPSSLTRPGMRHSRSNQPYQSGAGSFFTHCPSISVLPGSESLGVSSAMTQAPPIRALIDSKQSSWVSVSHGPTQEKDPSAGTTGIHALTGEVQKAVAKIDAKSEKLTKRHFAFTRKAYAKSRHSYTRFRIDSDSARKYAHCVWRQVSGVRVSARSIGVWSLDCC